MAKPDFSKQGMQDFFLYHTEKLILALSVILLGLFFWMGYKTPQVSLGTPSDLSKKADQAEQYVVKATAWEEIAEFRKGDKNVKAEIDAAVGNVKPSDFIIDAFSGIAARSLEPRVDPTIYPVEQLHASVFSSAMIISFGKPVPGGDPFSHMSMVVDESADDAMGMGMGMGFGGGDDEEEDYSGEDEDYGDEGGPTGPPFGGDKKEDDDDEKPEVDAGKSFKSVHSELLAGLRPSSLGISPVSCRAYNYNVVCVTGLVDFKEQFNEFETKLSDKIGYYPQRDQPIYQYVQVERRPVSTDGKDQKWTDISQQVNFQIPRLSPSMHRMPMAFFSSAPEDVAPENFDPILTQAIPGLSMVDYRPYTTHPELKTSREFPDPIEEEVEDEIEAEDVWDLGLDELGGADPLNTGGGGRGGPGGGGGMGGPPGGGMGGPPGGGMGGPPGGGMGGPPGGGMGGPPGGGGGRGGPGGDIGGGPGGFGTGGLGPADDVLQTRRGSDVTDYWRALTRKPTTDYKLVRFFDVHQKSGETYEYRVRVWLADPNNDDPNETFVQLRGSAGTATSIGGQDEDEDQEDGPDYDDEEGEMDEEGDIAAGGIGDEDEGPAWVKIPITSQMTTADVRKRLGKIQVETKMETKLDAEGKKYRDEYEEVTVAEPTIEKEEDGSTKYRFAKVPRDLFKDGTSSKTDLYLKYSRCSEWSDPIKVKIETSSSMVAAGELQPGKIVKMKDASGDDMVFEASEPVSEIVAAVWSNELGARVPAKRQVYRGDSLDFFAPSHVVHPITSQVYLYQTENKAITGMAKYMSPVQTKKVLVDAMGGDEIPLPRAEKMRHHLPTEMLVLNEFGEFEVRNDIDDQTAFRILSLKPDDSKYVGRDRRQKKEKNTGGGRGGPGGDMGF